jgi:aminoacyl tRNA synthase complex-interacting multifunctional protein 1
MDKQSLHPFARVDLRVGKIVKVEKHPNADRLYVEYVDLDEEEPRVVVSGLVEHVPIDELQDRLCIFICNLKPATLCKVLSSAMLLVAKDETGLLEPLIPPAGCVAGDRISIDGVTPQPDEVIKPKDTTWESVRTLLAMTNGIAHYESSPLIAGGKGNITSTKVFSGIIS